MAEVIGENPKYIKQTSCANCAAVIRYTDSETVVKIYSDYGGGSDTYRELNCPRCGILLQILQR